MPGLLHTLQGNDLSFLRMVANAWGVELNAPDAYTAVPLLVIAISDPQLVLEVAETLPVEAHQALETLLENEGRLSWAVFSRRFGEVRTIGAARRDRERPDLNPASPAEVLWYRALIGKAFLNLPPEPQEYAFIPDDLLEFLQPLSRSEKLPLGRPASLVECTHPIPANDHILDHACTLLAALRSGMELDKLNTQPWSIPVPVLQSLLHSAGLVNSQGQPISETVRPFLEASRPEALAQLVESWLKSSKFNELRLIPGLQCEGDWYNDPVHTRQVLLDLLSHTPQESWWSLAAFTAAVREQAPDFQRPAGDYDSWFIKRASDGQYLRGFAAWDEVDGALIRFTITGPLHWLGMMDLAAPNPQALPSAFRPSPWSAALWHGSFPSGLPVENASLRVSSDGRLIVPALTPRSARYQIARFCQWEGESVAEYTYRITPTSLERAQKQGLRTSHLLALLRRHSASALPPVLVQALERYEKFGVQAHIEQNTLLNLASPEVLTALQRSRAARFLGEVLNPTTVIIRPGGEEIVRFALAELGYLVEFKAGV